MLCDNLEGWDGKGWEGDSRGRGCVYTHTHTHTHTCMAASHCCMAETNNIVKQLPSNLKNSMDVGKWVGVQIK